jgi:hypothetical protein
MACALLVAACSSGAGKQSTPTSGARHGRQALATNVPAGVNPSVLTAMVCGKEVRDQIAASLNGLHETRVTTPTWSDHIYSCTYVYPKGSFKLSV